MLSRKKAKQNMEAYRSGFQPSKANANLWERLPSTRYGSVSKWFSAEQSERQPLREASINKIWKRIEVVITARTRNAVTEQSVQGFESLRFRQRLATPFWSQKKAVHTRWAAFLFLLLVCQPELSQKWLLTTRDAPLRCAIPSLRSFRIPSLPPTNLHL